MPIRHYQLGCVREASSNCYHKRKASKRFREKVVLIMGQERVSTERVLSNEQKPTIPEAKRLYLSSVNKGSCTAQYFRPGMGLASLNECETRRDELILWVFCGVNRKLFLGRGQTAKWFVPQQPLTISPMMGSTTDSTCHVAFVSHF